jgi:6-hydroxymethylpterin diphosphokinase MptE-like/Methyltransferase domain
MLQVACVRSGTKYGPEYVEILRDMICRNLEFGTKGAIHCFTDQPDNIEGIFIRPTEGHGGWWDKMCLFKPGNIPAGRRVWYFDLDVCIVGSLDEIFKYDGPFAALYDIYRPYGLQSSIMTWVGGELDHVWEEWVNAGCPRPPRGDQVVIQTAASDFVRLQEIFPGSFVSYKEDSVYRIPKGSSVVYFHGDPKPHEVKDGWVPHVWARGGNNIAELVHKGNTPETDIERNIKAACALDKPWLDAPAPVEENDAAIFVAGGPSINQQIPFLQHVSGRATVFAMNAAAHWCRRNGIKVDFQVMADARPQMKKMIDSRAARVFASQCHPSVTKRADLLFHAYGDGIMDLIPKGPEGRATTVIGGGSTVGLVALSVAHMMGYRKFHLFGYDSCLSGDNQHAYPQSLNDGQRVIDFTFADGPAFKCAPWMIKQLKDYQDLAPILVNHGCEITMYGEGLLQYYNAEMCKLSATNDRRADSIMSRMNGAETVNGVEIGVSHGGLSKSLLSRHSQLNLFGVDPYQQASADSAYYKSGDAIARTRSQIEHDDVYAAALATYKSFGDRAMLIRKPSLDAVAVFDDASLDFAFIDGDHSYEGARDDILAWAPKVKPGGWLCGHDYRNKDVPFPGVDAAVDEWVAATGRILETDEYAAWFVRMP